MEILKYGDLSYEVDHAVKGPDYVHGYDASGDLVVSFEGVTNFGDIQYTGSYLSPDKCLSEACNRVMNVNGELVREDGTPVTQKSLDVKLNNKMDKGVMSYYHPSDTDETGLNAWLESTVLPSMPDNTCKNVSICCGAIDPMIMMGVVYKNTNSWVIVDVVSHVNGHHFTKTKNGDWKNTVVNDSVFSTGDMEGTASYFPKLCKFYIVDVQVSTPDMRYYHSFAIDAYILKNDTPRYYDFEIPIEVMGEKRMSGCRLTAKKRSANKDIAFTLAETGVQGPLLTCITKVVGYN